MARRVQGSLAYEPAAWNRSLGSLSGKLAVNEVVSSTSRRVLSTSELAMVMTIWLGLRDREQARRVGVSDHDRHALSYPPFG
jgi:hypothetical protein